jgi:hypothetical protein
MFSNDKLVTLLTAYINVVSRETSTRTFLWLFLECGLCFIFDLQMATLDFCTGCAVG